MICKDIKMGLHKLKTTVDTIQATLSVSLIPCFTCGFVIKRERSLLILGSKGQRARSRKFIENACRHNTGHIICSFDFKCNFFLSGEEEPYRLSVQRCQHVTSLTIYKKVTIFIPPFKRGKNPID